MKLQCSKLRVGGPFRLDRVAMGLERIRKVRNENIQTLVTRT
jgi:hypothetical protein